MACLRCRSSTPLSRGLLGGGGSLGHATASEIDSHTASWVVDDVSKLPEELRSCCVCLEDVCPGNKVRTLPCLHTFHAACAEEWLKKKKVCPLCQFSIDGEDPSVAEQQPAPAAS